MGNLHSVTLDSDKCVGCTDCIKRCPTEAIRVRNSKAEIMDERCIDCGMCIRICRNNAKQALTDPIEKINEYKYKVAIPAPTLYTQFKRLRDPNIILTGLKYIGFDEVFEVAKAAEIVTEYTKKIIEEKDIQKPIISSACPAIVKLIQIRFPTLIPNILPVISPKEAAVKTMLPWRSSCVNTGHRCALSKKSIHPTAILCVWRYSAKLTLLSEIQKVALGCSMSFARTAKLLSYTD